MINPTHVAVNCADVAILSLTEGAVTLLAG
jgi:hypothetical protein